MEVFEQCVTTSGVPCIFPFKYRGVEYTECTTVGSVGGTPWCATEVDEDGNLIRGAYGNCNEESCEATTTVTTTPTTTTTSMTTSTESTEPPLPCPMEKQNAVKGKKIKIIKEVKKWKDCAEQCQEHGNSCVAWTLMIKKKLCTLLSKYKSFKKDTKYVSGASDCPVPPTTTTMAMSTEAITTLPTTATNIPEEFTELNKETIVNIKFKDKSYSCNVIFDVSFWIFILT